VAAEKPNPRALAGTGLPWASILLALGLFGLLALQIILIERERLAKHAVLRPAISQLCLWTGCQLSSWRQPDAFIVIQQSMEADPVQADTLIAQVSFKNDAKWPQPWPQIELALTDINGQTVALRRFSPKEYLNEDQQTEIKANQIVSAEIALQESAGKAVGFRFDFD
jgi:hypothetical protein